MRSMVRRAFALLAVLLCLACGLGVESAVAANYPFSDLNDDTPHVEDIVWLSEEGIAEGWENPDGSFHFGGMSSIVRQDMAAFLRRLAVSLGDENAASYEPTDEDKKRFTDVSEATPHAEDIWWLASEGISEGWDNGDGTSHFGGMSSVVRQDMAAFLRRLSVYLNDYEAEVYQSTDENQSSFTDVTADTSHAEDIWWLATNGISTGWENQDGSFHFSGMSPVVRQDMAAFLHRLDGHVVEMPKITFSDPADEHIQYDEASDIHYVDNEVLVTGRMDASQDEIESVIHSVGATIVGKIDITKDYQIQFDGVRSLDELEAIVNDLSSKDCIESASVHALYEMSANAVPNDAEWKSDEWSADFPEDTNWGVEAIDAMGAWDHYNEMTYVKVGIIDTMFDTGHEDLVYTKVWNNPSNLNEEPSDVGPEHGTHVSGTIAAGYNNNLGIAGVAPKVEFYGYSVLGSATDAVPVNYNLAGGMEWKYALAQLIVRNCRVVNVSMGLSKPNMDASRQWGEVLGDFLSKLLGLHYDFVIVQAAGNNSADTLSSGIFIAIENQSVKDRVLVVGAIGNNGSHKNGLFGWFGDRVFDGYYYADFSNYGARVDVVAPGVDIFSSVPNDKYEGGWNGTSMAAPHVSGVAAMCYAVNPSLSGAQVKDIIVDSAESTVTDNSNDHSEHRTYPMLNADNAVDQALETSGDAVSPVNPSFGIVMGGIRDNATDSTVGDVEVTAYRISDGDGNLSDYAASTRSDADGNYELALEAGSYYINMYKDGYLPFSICNVTVANDQVLYLDTANLIADSGAEANNLVHGTVRNALSGQAIEGVTVTLRPGWDNQSGSPATNPETGESAVGLSDSYGYYSVRVQEGCYTAELSKDGYISSYVNVVCSNQDSDQDGVLTPVLSDDEFRVVLTWSEEPSDLDSHLVGPLASGEEFHVFYSDMSAYDGDNLVASLDLDDTSSYGPETITFTNTGTGVFKYAVHNFSYRYDDESTSLSMSGAKVEVYQGNELKKTYHVPVNTAGTVWNVFEIEGDSIRDINTMESISDPWYVGSSVSAQSSSGPSPYVAEKDYAGTDRKAEESINR